MAHIAGAPVEELLPTLIGGVGTGLALTLSSIRSAQRLDTTGGPLGGAPRQR